MPNKLRLMRGTAAQNDAYLGEIGEVTVDSTNLTLRVHDSITPGGVPLVNKPSLAKDLFTHTQTIPQSTWEITHGLKGYPNAVVLDSLGRLIYGEVVYVSESRISLLFSQPVAGKAILR